MPNRPARSLRALGATLLLLTLSVLVSLVLAEIFVRWLAPQPVGLSWMIRDGRWVHVPGRETIFRRPEYAAPVWINSLVFCGAEFEIPKAPDTFPVLVIGDSFVEGLQVAEDATFVARIERPSRARIRASRC